MPIKDFGYDCYGNASNIRPLGCNDTVIDRRLSGDILVISLTHVIDERCGDIMNNFLTRRPLAAGPTIGYFL